MAASRCIYSEELDRLKTVKSDELKSFSLKAADPEKLRFLQVNSILNEDTSTLQIYEFADLEGIADIDYATASHVWRGLTTEEKDPGGIRVDGLKKHDPLNVEVLQIICAAARKEGCQYLWLDKLCVRQDESKEGEQDRNWQVPRMYQLYAKCRVCLVAPGGLTRLPFLHEQTTWLERLWTLQEALAPKLIKCLFQWSEGDAVLQHNAPMFIEEVARGKAAMAELSQILVVCIKGGAKLLRNGDTGGSFEEAPHIEVNVFGTVKTIEAPDGSTTSDNSSLNPARVLLGSVTSETESSNADSRASAVWWAMLMRTAKFPQDLIFGCMGLFGVNVPPIPGISTSTAYDNRQLAQLLVDFTQRVVAKGYGAQWLGILPTLSPPAAMTCMPLLPVSKELGGAAFRLDGKEIVPVSQLMPSSIDLNWWLSDAIRPSQVHANGDLTFTAKAVSISSTDRRTDPSLQYAPQRDHPTELTCIHTERIWTLHKSSEKAPFAVVIGTRIEDLRGDIPAMVVPNTTLLMLLEEKDGVLRNVGYAWGDSAIAADWAEHEFTAGGAKLSSSGIDLSLMQ